MIVEQQEIVRRVEVLFALADQLEVRLAKAHGQVDQHVTPLLARASAGQLVPQDPHRRIGREALGAQPCSSHTQVRKGRSKWV